LGLELKQKPTTFCTSTIPPDEEHEIISVFSGMVETLKSANKKEWFITHKV
jgi:hypothetical protein